MKDIGVCYAFVEFEDIAGVQNAIKVKKTSIYYLVYIYHSTSVSGFAINIFSALHQAVTRALGVC